MLGKNSLLVYWVHLTLIYGSPAARIQHALTLPQTALAALAVTALMLLLSVAWMWWKGRRAESAPPACAVLK